jgi:hypothetical protein
MKNPKTLTTYELSLYVAQLSGAQPNHCFHAAWEAIINFVSDGSYVEGWIVLEIDDEIEVIEHAWCTFSDGTIVDPAMVLVVGPEVPMLYFTGIEYTREEALSFEDEWLPRVRFTQYGDDGMDHADYKAAYDNALARAEERATTTGKRIAIHVAEQQNEEEIVFEANISGKVPFIEWE